jgi:hypothetical protein
VVEKSKLKPSDLAVFDYLDATSTALREKNRLVKERAGASEMLRPVAFCGGGEKAQCVRIFAARIGGVAPLFGFK